ncbi:MAG TPA: hypothetical protein VFA39_15480 [Steroidobacteraceae bacterium]|nr:hypothetical protein [Steroidobacteraceae bacterium]
MKALIKLLRRLFPGPSVDSIVGDIVLKAEQLENLSVRRQGEIEEIRVEVNSKLTEMSTKAAEADRALNVCRRLMALVEG